MGRCGSLEALPNTRFRTRVVPACGMDAAQPAWMNSPPSAGGRPWAAPTNHDNRNNESREPNRSGIPGPTAGEEAGGGSVVASF